MDACCRAAGAHRATLTEAQGNHCFPPLAMQAGSRPAWKSPVNNRQPSALVLPDVPFPFRVSFCSVRLCRCRLRLSRLCAASWVVLPRRPASLPRSISILSDSLYRLWIGFFFPPANWKGFCCCCRRVIRCRSCHGNYLHLQSVIFVFFLIIIHFFPLCQSFGLSHRTVVKLQVKRCRLIQAAPF